jgi:hypothetical protein
MRRRKMISRRVKFMSTYKIRVAKAIGEKTLIS